MKIDSTKIAQGCALAAMALVTVTPVSARADRDDWHHSDRGHHYHYGWNQQRNPHHRYFYQWQGHNSWYWEHKRIPLHRDWDDNRWNHRDRDDFRAFGHRDRDFDRR